MIGKAGLRDLFYVDSAATSREEIGNPIYPPMERTLKNHGIECTGHRARQMTRADYDSYDLLIGADDENLYYMNRICGGDPEGKLSLLLDWTDRPGSVADPWYTDDFDETWRDVTEGCEAFLQMLKDTGLLYRS